MTKLNATGSALVYSTYLGGSGDDRGHGIAVDAAGNAYVTGVTDSTNFPTTAGGFRHDAQRQHGDAFVTKLNADRLAPLVYSTYLGGKRRRSGLRDRRRRRGQRLRHRTDRGRHANFPTTAGAFDTTFNGHDRRLRDEAERDRLRRSSTRPSSAEPRTTAATASRSTARATPTSPAGPLVGPSRRPRAPSTRRHNGGDDVFVTKLNATGSLPPTRPSSADNGADRGFGIAFDASGNAYVTGETQSSGLPDHRRGLRHQLDNGDGNDAFVTKLNPTGTAPLSYSTFLGGSSSETGFGIALDATGNAYVTGETASTNFPTTAGAFDTSYNGSGDAFVTKLNATGSTPLAYSTYLGGSERRHGPGDRRRRSEQRLRHRRDRLDTNFPTTAGAFDTTFNTDGDAFVTKLDTVAAGGAATLAINDVSQNEGNAGTTAFIFTVTKSGSTAVTSTVDYATGARHARPPALPAVRQYRLHQPERDAHLRPDRRRPRRSRSSSAATRRSSRTRPSSSTSRTRRRDDHRRPGPGHDPQRRRRADPVDQRRLADEGNVGTTTFTFTVTKSGSTGGRPRLSTTPPPTARANGGAACVGSTDYVSQSGTLTFAPDPDDPDDHDPRLRRPDVRAERDLLRQPVERRGRDDHRQPGHGHDHQRRRRADPVDQRRHRRTRATSARPRSSSRSPRPARPR